jgi:hypothetical protein
LNPQTLQTIGTVIGFVLTVCIFSYLLGDNFLYRIAIHIFIGAAAGYVLIVAVESVLIPWINFTLLAQPMVPAQFIVGLVPFLIGLLLLAKGSPRYSRLGDLGLVIVLAVGGALALWGAISGTLIPLVTDAARGFQKTSIFDGLIALIGTITVLVYFTYVGARRQGGETRQLLPVRFTGIVGQVFIVVTLGAFYGMLIISALAVLVSVITQRVLVFPIGS